MSTQCDAGGLLEQFPIEVWRQIMEALEDINSYYNICSASTFFTNFSTPTRIKIKTLFTKLLPILSNYLFPFEEGGEYENLAARLSRLSIGDSQNEKMGLLNMRRVCRDWKLGVDTMLQSTIQFNDVFGNGMRHPIFDTEAFKRHQDFVQFDHYFRDTHNTPGANPFLCRKISLHFGNTEITPTELEFLQTYGHHVWHCVLELGRVGDTDLRRCYKWIRDVLTLLPNLRAIETNVDHFFSSINAGSVEVACLQTFVHYYPLPVFEHLEFVKMRGIFKTFEVIANTIIRSNPQISMLETEMTKTSQLFHNNLPNLTHLSVTFRSEQIVVESQLRTLKMSPDVWKLTTLDITIRTSGVSWILLFQTLEQKFANTLRELRIRLPAPTMFENHSRLSLPNLEVLSVFLEHYTTLDFILPMSQNLEQLSVELGSISPADAVELRHENQNNIQFFRHRRNVYQSNIWTMFPKIKMIQCATYEPVQTVTKYNREKWLKLSIPKAEKSKRS